MGNRALRYRIYPNTAQMEQILKTVGSCRFVYNDALTAKESAYKESKTVLTAHDLIRRLPELKKQYPWLKEADSIALQQSLRHLGTAYANFFNPKLHAKRPKYKTKRKSRWSYTTVMTNNNIRIGENHIILPKLGRVKAVISREIPEGWNLKSTTVCVERDYSVYVSCLFEYADISVSYIPDPALSIGLDYKSDGLYVDSSGRCCGSPKYFRKAQKRLTKAQRGLRHKKYGSRNYRKQNQRVARIHRHTANQRRDFLHKESVMIAKLYDIVCIENLDMTAIAKRDSGLGKASLDNGWGMFVSFLEYKLRDRGKMLIRTDRYFASSQTCSCCMSVNPKVKDLKIRKWTCPTCGAVHDRDINAATNIKREGLRILSAVELDKVS